MSASSEFVYIECVRMGVAVCAFAVYGVVALLALRVCWFAMMECSASSVPLLCNSAICGACGRTISRCVYLPQLFFAARGSSVLAALWLSMISSV